MIYTIYHNPRCSKSRQTLAILEKQGIHPEIRFYLENPVTKDELQQIINLLEIKPIEICRTQEPLFTELGLSKNDTNEVIFDAILKNPKLLERPIVVRDNKKAIVGRPPENVETLL